MKARARYLCLVEGAVIRRPGKHANHFHPGEVRFERLCSCSAQLQPHRRVEGVCP